jgi:biotin carboxyl carrier protein
MRFAYRSGERLHEVELSPQGAGSFRAVVDGVLLDLAVEPRGGGALDLVGSEGRVRAWVGREGALRFVTAPGIADLVLERVEARRVAAAAASGPELASPMPGRVVKLLVAEGDRVERGAPLVVVEAMKTELTIVAQRPGRVARVQAQVGEMCEAGKPLLELHATEAPAEET